MPKRAVLSYSGSSGKTLVSMHLLLPRMQDAAFFAIETINLSAADLGAKNVHTLKGNDFGKLIEELVLEDDAIIDIGASNIERFFEEMSRFDGATDEIDQYIIPITPEAKSWQEGAKTAAALSELGIPKDKIIMLPNRIERDPTDEIPGIYAFVKSKKVATIYPDAFLFESEVFDYLNFQRSSFTELVSDDTDYKALARAAETAEDRSKYAQLYRWNKQALPIHHHHDDVFATITGA